MKKRYIIYTLILLSDFNSFAHQGPVQPLFSPPQSVQPQKPGQLVISKERKPDGSPSNVLAINGLESFVTLCKKFGQRPIIIKIYSNDKNPVSMYQEMATKYSDKSLFISLDATRNPRLLHFLMNILIVEKKLTPVNNSVPLPIFLFCNKESIETVSGKINFKKDSLFLLCEPGSTDKELLSKNINANLDREKDSFLEKLSKKFKEMMQTEK